MDMMKSQQTPKQRSADIADIFDSESFGYNTPLSERPRGSVQDTSISENLKLLKETGKTVDEVKRSKDVSLVIVDTNALLNFGMKNSKQQQQFQNELKALLDHEKKIIQQILDRTQKFKEFKEDSKKTSDEFEDEHNGRIPFYSQYLKQLAELPETQNVTQEGMDRAIQAKVLYNIVESTTNTANNTIVQLSMDKTLINDIDLSMQKLFNFATFMITNLQNWNKTIESQENNLNLIAATYEYLNEDVNKLKQTSPVEPTSMKQDQIANLMKKMEDRLEFLENELKAMKSQTACNGNNSPTSSARSQQRKGNICSGRNQPLISFGSQQCQGPAPTIQCPPPRRDLKINDECTLSRNNPKTMNGNAGMSSFCVPSTEDRL